MSSTTFPPFSIFLGCALLFSPIVKTVAAAGLETAWQKPVPLFHSFSLSPSGEALAILYKNGRVQCISSDHKFRWGASFPGPGRIALSNTGEYALFYRPNSSPPQVLFLRNGKPVYRAQLNAPIMDGEISSDGSIGGVLTQTGELSLFRRNGLRFTASHQRLDKFPHTLLFPKSGEVVVGFRGGGGVQAFDIAGKRLWRVPGEGGRSYVPVPGATGKTLGLLSYRGGSEDRVLGSLLSLGGKTLWQQPIEGSFPSLSLGSDGDLFALGLTELLQSGDRKQFLRKIVCYDRRGRLLWEKGGPFFSPQLIAVVEGESTVIARGPGADFYFMNARGNLNGIYRHRSAVIRTVASRNGHALAVWCQDGQLYYLRWKK